MSESAPVAQTTATLLDAFDRVHELVPEVLQGLNEANLLWRPDPEANSIGWVIWHLCRVEDEQITGVAEALGIGHAAGPLWQAGGFAAKFKLPYPIDAVGYGQTSTEVGEFRATPALLREYAAAVAKQTDAVLGGLDERGYAVVVDKNYQPPVTASVRLVSTLIDIAQHIGQAAYLKGLNERENQ